MTPSLLDVRARLGSALTEGPPGLPTADRICRACVELLAIDGAAISMVHRGHSNGTFGASSAVSRRLDEYQFTFGEGPCLDAVSARAPVLVADLDSPGEQRWPAFAGAVLGEGLRAVFALPIMITSVCVGALDLFRAGPGPLADQDLAGGRLAAELAVLPLLDLIASTTDPDPPVVDGEGWEQIADLDRMEVHHATGMLISQLDVDAAEALVRLRAHAIATGRTASSVARDIIERRLVLGGDSTGGDPGGGPA